MVISRRIVWMVCGLLVVVGLITYSVHAHRRCKTKSECGYKMHKMSESQCEETCTAERTRKMGWSCGGCDDGSTATKAFQPPTTSSGKIGNLPSGPYIASGYSERITLPQPRTPKSLSTPRSNCPHTMSSGLKDWHTASTWPNGVVPRAGQAVTIPPNTKVVIKKSVTEILGLITIPSTSSLIIGEASGGIQLQTTGMDVIGSLIAGSETCLIQTPIAITLHGARPSDPVKTQPAPTYKGISVTGVLSLHGKRYFRTWTRLSKTVLPGDKALLLQDAVNWEPGQWIVVTTTAMKDSREWHRNELHKIAQVDSPNPVSGVGAAVALVGPMKYRHTANQGYQAEVGLLTRTIVIQGSATDSEPTDKDPLTCTLPNDVDRYGDTGMPCPFKEITGFGGHVMVHKKGKGFVEGVEFYRMGQTNVLGRYPMHFHLLGSCPKCYVRDSSFHRSFYRCVSVHGTHNMTVTENVAYDVTGYCYYLEDGVEEDNTISFNLAAHIHAIGKEPPGLTGSQELPVVQQGPRLTLPADVTASGFYITNVHNNLIGNAASGGWAGFAFPLLTTPLQSFRNNIFRPSSVTSLKIDGNTAHSTGWWWYHGPGFYFGGSLYYNSNGVLEYNPGRSGDRSTCKVNNCALGECESWGCPPEYRSYLRITNSKAFLIAGVGLNSWTGSMEVVGWESHDTGLSIESLASGFWIDKALAVCRTGEDLVVPTRTSNWWQRIGGTGFVWYDTDQDHIITESVFRNCGYRSDDFNQYDTSVGRGCDDNESNGCEPLSTTFGFLTHSDEFTPEIMQGTRAIKFENCGRRFSLANYLNADTVSGRSQNWLDVDGSASGRGVPTFMVSGSASAAKWWTVDDNVGYDPQGPLRFIDIQPKVGGPTRGLGHARFWWDSSQHDQVGSSLCGNGEGQPCPSLGYLRHAGRRFTSSNKTGMPITARGELLGPVGGYGWILELNGGAPRNLRLEQIEVLPETPMLISIAYPLGTQINITAHAPEWCYADDKYTCSQSFTKARSLKEVRTGPGNQYFVDAFGVLTFRAVMLPQDYIGHPNWFLPSRTDLDWDGKRFVLDRYERSGVFLPRSSYFAYYTVDAICGGSGPYCAGKPIVYDPDVCPSGYTQLAYDYCCSKVNPNNCVFAGSN